MSGKISGLQTRIRQIISQAWYVHCFAHQLNLTLVAIAKMNAIMVAFCNIVNQIYVVTSASTKRADILKKLQIERIRKEMNDESAHSTSSSTPSTASTTNLPRKGNQNQIKTPNRIQEVRWNTLLFAIQRIFDLFKDLVKVIDIVSEEADDPLKRQEASSLNESILHFEFVFNLFFMKEVLTTTLFLSETLKKKDQDFLNAVSLVKQTKEKLLEIQNSGFDKIWKATEDFCLKNNIDILEKNEEYAPERRYPGRRVQSWRSGTGTASGESVTNEMRYKRTIFNPILTEMSRDMNERFNGDVMNLLTFANSLLPTNDFAYFNDGDDLMSLAGMYPEDFNHNDKGLLYTELQFLKGALFFIFLLL